MLLPFWEHEAGGGGPAQPPPFALRFPTQEAFLLGTDCSQYLKPGVAKSGCKSGSPVSHKCCHSLLVL